ncbi:DUF4383 domain-containing protein [Aneurinibacillus terranovensis]|uniref:DUF4383 domain-containing protein n=1 Tax=Aneurinibacillus terranovensis TaxID=278991 RepID=UPI0004097200|nr:DUF4383 domain-containing protein [Aneurinibacillus terranovensis]
MPKKFMSVVGVLLLLVGIMGVFVPFTGVLDLTFTHTIVYLVTGLLALAVSGNTKNSITLAKVIGIVYTLLGIAGLFTQHALGMMLMPLDTVLNFILGIAALVVSFKSKW